jgi:multicomponent Na+:H+ antiporter subunit F
MTVVVLLCGVLLAIGGALALIRAERGPSMLDRTVALDIVVTVLVAAVALYASVDRRTDVVPILVVLSLVGFVGSVTISRFASVEPAGEGRVRSREEIAQEEAERIRAEEEAEAQRRARRAREAEAVAVEGPQPAEDRHQARAEAEARAAGSAAPAPARPAEDPGADGRGHHGSEPGTRRSDVEDEEGTR